MLLSRASDTKRQKLRKSIYVLSMHLTIMVA